MTTVKTVAAHEVVRATYPRPVTAADEVGMAVGKAIDETLSEYSHAFGQSRRPSASAMLRLATEVLDRELGDADFTLAPDQRQQQLEAVAGVLQAFRRSEVMGLSRPRSRLILINEQVGVYAQPDYWDGRNRFYEMKSYRADPMPPDVGLQLRLFQCAFPGFLGFLACFDRHAVPVTTHISAVPPLASSEIEEVLRIAYRTGAELGQEKVLEYLDSPTIRYTLAR
jgi:hypothetical protein